jgi:hypothetical protein
MQLLFYGYLHFCIVQKTISTKTEFFLATEDSSLFSPQWTLNPDTEAQI